MSFIPNPVACGRVSPTFTWLRDHGGEDWVADLLRLADGITVNSNPGRLVSLEVGEGREREVPPSPQRLAWMIRNAHRLAPVDGRRWQHYRRRVIDNPAREEALRRLDQGITAGIPKQLILEGPTHADCLIETEHAFVWIEGKRNDWLSPSIAWDVTRDQLAAESRSRLEAGICRRQGLLAGHRSRTARCRSARPVRTAPAAVVSLRPGPHRLAGFSALGAEASRPTGRQSRPALRPCGPRWPPRWRHARRAPRRGTAARRLHSVPQRVLIRRERLSRFRVPSDARSPWNGIR